MLLFDVQKAFVCRCAIVISKVSKVAMSFLTHIVSGGTVTPTSHHKEEQGLVLKPPPNLSFFLRSCPRFDVAVRTDRVVVN